MIIELHNTSRQGKSLSVEDQASTIIERHGFKPRAQYGPVFVFDKAGK
jgi:hypothetical protein